MSTTWEMIAMALGDAAKAEDLVRELAFRRELRVDPLRALGSFHLWRRPAQLVPVAITVRERRPAA